MFLVFVELDVAKGVQPAQLAIDVLETVGEREEVRADDDLQVDAGAYL